jgi:hypothetical protein
MKIGKYAAEKSQVYHSESKTLRTVSSTKNCSCTPIRGEQNVCLIQVHITMLFTDYIIQEYLVPLCHFLGPMMPLRLLLSPMQRALKYILLIGTYYRRTMRSFRAAKYLVHHTFNLASYSPRYRKIAHPNLFKVSYPRQSFWSA